MKVKSILKFVGTIGVWELFDRGIEYILNRVRGAKMEEDLGNVLTAAQENVTSVLALCSPVLTLLEDIAPESMRSNRETLKSASLEGALNPHLNIETRIQLADRFFQCVDTSEQMFTDDERAELLTRMYCECSEGSLSNIEGQDYEKSIASITYALTHLDADAAESTRVVVDRCIRAYELVMGMYPEPLSSVSSFIQPEVSTGGVVATPDVTGGTAQAPLEAKKKMTVDGMDITAELLNDEGLQLNLPEEIITVVPEGGVVS